jgi:hypothetical protein
MFPYNYNITKIPQSDIKQNDINQGEKKPGVWMNENYTYGHKIVKCFNTSIRKWYSAMTSISVPPNTPMVISDQSLQYTHSDNFDNIQSKEIRVGKMIIMYVEKKNISDKCFPLYADTSVHSENIEYKNGETYITDADLDFHKAFTRGFYFKQNKKDMQEDLPDAEFIISINNSRLQKYKPTYVDMILLQS